MDKKTPLKSSSNDDDPHVIFDLICIVGVMFMVSMLASSVVEHVFESQAGRPKTIELVFVVSLLSTQHYRLEQ